MSHGERTFALMKQLRSPPIPRNYELFYAFTTSVNKTLCSEMRKAIESEAGLSDETAERIYREHVLKKDPIDKVDDVGSQVSEEMSEIMAVIESASVRAGTYGKSLQGVNAKLAAIESPQQLKIVLQELFETTNDMEEYNKELETKLVESKLMIDELQMSLELTRVESFTDELTGLTNRKRFDQAIDFEMSEAEESDEPLSLLMMDIDHFKAFNDTHGHLTGDQVLRLVAHTLKTNVKGRDYAARYGGEEFAIILPKTNLEAAKTLAEQIRVALKRKELVKKSTGESLGHVTLSIGVASYRMGESVREFIERADTCLYAAKELGRDTVTTELDISDKNLETTAA